MTNSKPDYRIGSYSNSSEDRNILSGLSLRKNKGDISEKTFSFLFGCSCNDNTCDTDGYTCDCNPECSCVDYVACKHCRCVDNCTCDDKCKCDDYCSCDKHCSCDSECSHCVPDDCSYVNAEVTCGRNH